MVIIVTATDLAFIKANGQKPDSQSTRQMRNDIDRHRGSEMEGLASRLTCGNHGSATNGHYFSSALLSPGPLQLCNILSACLCPILQLWSCSKNVMQLGLWKAAVGQKNGIKIGGKTVWKGRRSYDYRTCSSQVINFFMSSSQSVFSNVGILCRF